LAYEIKPASYLSAGPYVRPATTSARVRDDRITSHPVTGARLSVPVGRWRGTRPKACPYSGRGGHCRVPPGTASVRRASRPTAASHWRGGRSGAGPAELTPAETAGKIVMVVRRCALSVGSGPGGMPVLA